MALAMAVAYAGAEGGANVPLTGQQGSWFWARDFDDPHSHSVTVQVASRDVFAEVALYDVIVLDEEFHSSMAGISRIVSSNGTEIFEINEAPLKFRRGVTSITFKIHVINCEASARWMLHFWS